jgi:hypothetical protein
MSDSEADMIDDANADGDEFLTSVKACASSLINRRQMWLTAMDAQGSDLHKDNDHLLAFSAYGFSRYMTPSHKQQFCDIIGAGVNKNPITLDQFETGSAQFNRLVVTLVQLGYAQVACSTSPDNQHLLDQVIHLVQLLQARQTQSADDLLDLTAWKLLAGSYAAADVPRCLDKVNIKSESDAQMLELALFAIDRQKLLKRLQR